MTPEERRALVGSLHASPGRIVLAVTGGGAAALTDLLGVPGASRTVLEMIVPYAGEALAALTAETPGPDPELTPGGGPGAVSEATATLMARAALRRARRYVGGSREPVAGVAVTAALVTDRERRGADRACLAWKRGDGAGRAWTVVLDKAMSDEAQAMRLRQDRSVADQVLRAIAEAIGLPHRRSGAQNALSQRNAPGPGGRNGVRD